MSTEKRPPEPSDSFLRELDEALADTVRFDCIGEFVVTQLYGFERPTADIDVIELTPREQADRLMGLALKGRPLHRNHKVYLDLVGVAVLPENY
jgi:hypothetical protein